MFMQSSAFLSMVKTQSNDIGIKTTKQTITSQIIRKIANFSHCRVCVIVSVSHGCMQRESLLMERQYVESTLITKFKCALNGSVLR